nr:hypothetical protein Iba_chr05eCG12510 [Ipomoea batatas]
MMPLRIVLKHFILLLEIKILISCVSTKILPPLEHISPHLLGFLNVEFPSPQKPGYHMIIVVFCREQFVENKGLTKGINCLDFLGIVFVLQHN